MNKIDIAGLKIDAVGKAELLEILRQRIVNGQKTWLTTIYSEFLFAALDDKKNLEMLNRADIAIADGVGVFWARKFLSLPLTATSYIGKIFQSFWQAKYSLFLTLINSKYCSVPIYRPFLEQPINGHATQTADRIPGSELIWDLAKLAAQNNLSIYLLGGFGETAELTANKLISKSANQLKVAGFSNKNPNDPTIYDDIKKASPDLLFVAYGPIKQEAWIAANLPNLPVKLAIGLGGTFDYIAGKRPQPPKIMRKIGLEWLWRLFTQPHRIKRIKNATWGLVISLIKFKLYGSLPFRQNVASVIINSQNKIFVAKFNPAKKAVEKLGYKNTDYQNYWQLPQGGREDNESAEQAAIREVTEETGIKNAKVIYISKHTNAYNWVNTSRRPLWAEKRYRFKGQNQNVAYLKFFGEESEIKLDTDELLEYKWVAIEDLEKIIHPEKIGPVKIFLADLKEMREKAIL